MVVENLCDDLLESAKRSEHIFTKVLTYFSVQVRRVVEMGEKANCIIGKADNQLGLLRVAHYGGCGM